MSLKRARIARRTPLRRKTRLRYRAKKPKRRPEDVDEEYKAWIREQDCCVAVESNVYEGCWGPIDPHHAGEKPGKGMKAPDQTCIPKCRRHHEQYEDHAGYFKGWSRERRREWSDDMIAKYRSVYIEGNGQL